ncbi:two-component system, chemotaxis family, response regulator CheB [Rhodovulum sp. ES.010]|uniref:CheB methylesterase domain-containing protein n=1 Tax=Rhodovulum sp. ES.010 TaxID=1882821 RepID=UPI000928EC82|nr:CheB methylesterase domain-containing protein [Rhodovulum sp. ES.010]SIO03066.1 two-component system, chemotaxis family, response regulator CheB [Rhodovulum sp. ES.010]
MRVMIADDNPETLQRLATTLRAVRGVTLGTCTGDLSATYHAAESRPPQAVMIAERLTRLPEFEVMQKLFQALGIRCVVVADGDAPQARLASRLDGSGIRVTHLDASPEEVRQCLLELLLDRSTAVEPPDGPAPCDMAFQPGRLILIGASTGGVDALIRVLSGFPANCPPTLIVQHTSGTFSAGLARLLDRRTSAHVTEAEDGIALEPGKILIAPGKDHHLELARAGSLRGRLRAEPPRSGHRPSVDALFQSAVPVAARVSAAILTGMGRDGAAGMAALRNAGAHTIGQDQASSLVYGMPRAAHEIGAVAIQLPLEEIGPALLQSCIRRSAA